MTTACGTGDWTGPLPGDPDNNVLLTASPAFGGIDVSWTYPTIYPHAVAHTLLYRSTSSNYATAVQRSVVAGNFFYDKLATGITYYYWIQIISVNGTVGELIGPASTMAQSLIGDLITELSGQISVSELATALKTPIELIPLLNGAINQEILDRIAEAALTSEFLQQVQTAGDDVATFVENKVIELVDANGALVIAIDAIGVIANNNSAAIISVEATRIGYCIINSLVSAHETKALCKAANGVWQGGLPLASAVKQVSVSHPDSGSAILETSMTAQRSLNDGFKAQYTVRLNVSNPDGSKTIGGFGLYGKPNEVSVGFDVTKFWIGNPGSSPSSANYPFIVNDGVVHITKTTIKDADIETLKIEGNAVTVPVSVEGYSNIAGNGTYQVVATLYIKAPLLIPMNITGLFNGRVGYSAGLVSTAYKIYKTDAANTDTVYRDYGLIAGAFIDMPSLQFTASLIADEEAWFHIAFFGADNTVGLQQHAFMLLGVKR